MNHPGPQVGHLHAGQGVESLLEWAHTPHRTRGAVVVGGPAAQAHHPGETGEPSERLTVRADHAPLVGRVIGAVGDESGRDHDECGVGAGEGLAEAVGVLRAGFGGFGAVVHEPLETVEAAAEHPDLLPSGEEHLSDCRTGVAGGKDSPSAGLIQLEVFAPDLSGVDFSRRGREWHRAGSGG